MIEYNMIFWRTVTLVISPGVFFISDLAERQLFMAGSVLLLDILVVTIYDKKIYVIFVLKTSFRPGCFFRLQ